MRESKKVGSRQRQTQQPLRRQTFSYYSSRPAQAPQSRNESRASAALSYKKRSKQAGRSYIKSLLVLVRPIILLGAAFVIFQLFALSPDATIHAHTNGDTVTLNDAEKAIYKKQVDTLLKKSLLNRTKITVNSKGIAKQLQAAHPELREVLLVPPVIGSSPIVTITLSRPAAKLNVAGHTYSIDQNGFIVASDSDSAQLPLIVDESGTLPRLGEQFLPGTTVTSVLQVEHQLTAAGLGVKGYTLPAANPYELVVRLNNKGYAIRLNLKADILQQCGAVAATIRHLGTTEPKEYLDMRVQGRAYYK